MIRRIKLLFLLFLAGRVSGQEMDTTLQLQQVQSKLQSGTTVEYILTDNRWMFLHAKTDFRQLIRHFTNTTQLTIITATEKGERIDVTGIVKTEKGQPVRDALVYCYHTDNRGFYAFDTTHIYGHEGDRRHARLFGYLKTDADGKFILHTIHPRGYPNSILPCHIHCEIEASGYDTIVTELLFDEDSRLTQEQRIRSQQEGFLIAKAINNTYNYILSLKKTNLK